MTLVLKPIKYKYKCNHGHRYLYINIIVRTVTPYKPVTSFIKVTESLSERPKVRMRSRSDDTVTKEGTFVSLHTPHLRPEDLPEFLRHGKLVFFMTL